MEHKTGLSQSTDEKPDEKVLRIRTDPYGKNKSSLALSHCALQQSQPLWRQSERIMDAINNGRGTCLLDPWVDSNLHARKDFNRGVPQRNGVTRTTLISSYWDDCLTVSY